MPWDYKPWGCGSGSKGSCNNGWIQFEICEDNLTDKTYFDKIYKEACELTAYLCELYNLDPKGTVTVNGVKVPVILCHADSYNLGLGSNHGDVLHWFSKHGKTMDDVRNDVVALMGPTRKAGDVNNDGKVDETDAQTILNHVAGKVQLTGEDLKVADYNKDNKVNTADARAILNTTTTTATAASEMYRIRKTWADATSQKGAFTNLDNAKKACDAAGAEYKVFNSKGEVVYPQSTTTTATTTTTSNIPYQVIITANKLNVRSGPSTSFKVNTTVRKNEIFTIVEEKNDWGKLKSGAGWIALEYTKKR